MKTLRYIALAFFLGTSVALVSGCSSGPSADEMAQLDQLKAETESLKKDIAAKEAEKKDLESQIAQKKEELATAEKNQSLTRERLKSQQ